MGQPRWRGPLLVAIHVLIACGRHAPGESRTRLALEVRVQPTAAPPQDMYERCFGKEPPPQGPLTEIGRMEAGFQVFAHTCVTCHQPAGTGMPNAFPPLAGSDFLMADKARSIDVVLRGLSGSITVDDRAYRASMPPHAFLTDDDVANVLTFVRNSWGNKGEPVTREEVAERRLVDAAAMVLEIEPGPSDR